MLAEITSQDENDFVQSKIGHYKRKYILNSNVVITSLHIEHRFFHEQEKSSDIEQQLPYGGSNYIKTLAQKGWIYKT